MLKGLPAPKRLVLGYYLKFFQRYAQFPGLTDVVPEAVAQFLAEQIEYEGPLPSHVASWDQNLMTEWYQRDGGRGVMIYWHVDKQATCVHSQLKQVSSSEVASMIEGVLHHGTDLDIDRQFVPASAASGDGLREHPHDPGGSRRASLARKDDGP